MRFAPLLLLCACATVPKPPPIDGARIDAAAGQEIDAHAAAGVSIAVGHAGHIIFSRAYGKADLEAGTPATPETRYPIMSVSKAMTAVAALSLVEEGRLALEDPVQKYLPQIPPGVTVYHLVTHTSGLAEFFLLDEYQKAHPAHPAEVVPMIAQAPLTARPGEKFDYLNTNYLLLGLVVEKAAARPLAEVLTERVFRPAGMTSSSLDCSGGARGYAIKGKELVAPPIFYVPPADGSASVCSTAPDLVRFGQALLRGKLLRPETVKRMLSPAHLGDGKPIEFGLGMELNEFDDIPSVTILGGGSGYTARLHHFRDADLTVAVVANTQTNAVGRLRFLVGRAIRGLAPPGGPTQPVSEAERAAVLGDYQFEGFVMNIESKDGTVTARVGDPAAEPLVYYGDGLFGGTEDANQLLRFHGDRLVFYNYGLPLLGERIRK